MSTRASVADVRGRPAFQRGARLGYAANGVLNLAIGWLALQVAWGAGSEEASATGALRTLAGTPVGGFLLWVLLVGFALLGLWQLTTALLGGRTGERLKAAGKGVVYLALAVAAYGVVDQGGSGSSGSGGSSEAGWTADLMAQPLGRLLVAAVGAGVIAVGAYHVHKGWTRTFLRDLREHPGPWVVRAGRLGYVARGVAFGVVGGLFVAAAATADPDRAQGLDGALQTLRDAPFGQWLLTIVALGFVAYGVYSFVRARVGRV
ncbi:DUF1206 domain-containing protein [Actinotalea fermentans]|uniref:Membrane protein n=1 Tax=Actinotalea fermentans TaxID=43671 RepID=A0A511YY82_9CELL|nr:DUF1206 domain-containing protein [Actinotalea fermentans]GEN80165.1 membrane protein [Actinotalea fermentans]